eukprot:3086044-Pleurochrysis_carterae.AAC.1
MAAVLDVSRSEEVRRSDKEGEAFADPPPSETYLEVTLRRRRTAASAISTLQAHRDRRRIVLQAVVVHVLRRHLLRTVPGGTLRPRRTNCLTLRLEMHPTAQSNLNVADLAAGVNVSSECSTPELSASL